MNKKISRISCFVLVLIIISSMCISCKARPLTPSQMAVEAVGKVGEYTVPYEELYLLASTYDRDGMSEDELWDEIKKNITVNYAILTLCDRMGVEYDEKQLEDDIDTRVESMINTDFGGKRKNYLDAMKKSGLTDHYVRFTMRTDLLYAKLAAALAQNGEIATEEAEIIAFIKENFVRTRHFMVADNAGDDTAANRQLAADALADLRDGKTNMHKLIGSAANEDLLIPADGYAFARGSMEKAYEDAAFALEVGEYSEVISAMGETANGEYVNCYYVIERIELDDEYIDKSYATLYESYSSSVVQSKVEQLKAELEFIPNDYALSLDIKNLEAPPAGTDVYLIITLCSCVAGAAAVAVVVIITVKHFKKKKARLLAQKAQRSLDKGNKK